MWDAWQRCGNQPDSEISHAIETRSVIEVQCVKQTERRRFLPLRLQSPIVSYLRRLMFRPFLGNRCVTVFFLHSSSILGRKLIEFSNQFHTSRTHCAHHETTTSLTAANGTRHCERKRRHNCNIFKDGFMNNSAIKMSLLSLRLADRPVEAGSLK